ncbi:MAG: hypothetical protein ACKV2T_26185 [Kofleriaceae bacterium]
MMSHAPVAHRWILVAAIGLAPATVLAQGVPAPTGDATPGGEAEGQPATTDATVAPPSDAAPTDPPAVVTTPAKPTPDEPRFTFEPFGYLRLQYRAMRNDPFVEFVGRDDGFELQNAQIGLRGRLAHERASYVLSIDGAVDERAQVNVPDGKLRVGLRDAFADVRVSGTVAVRAGYFESLVDPDLDDDTQRDFVDRPLVSRGVRPAQGYQTPGLPPGRSLGAALRLDPGERVDSGVKVGFELVVQNGADEFASDNDNDLPALSLSAFARMPNRTWLVASGRWNRRTDGELPLQRDEDDFQGSAGARIAAGPVAFGAGGVVQRTQFPTTAGPVRNAYGAHASIVFTVPSSRDSGMPIGIGYRFGILDPSSLILTDRVMEHSAGAVVSVPSLRLRVQLQLTLAMEQGNRDLANDRAQLCAELSL